MNIFVYLILEIDLSGNDCDKSRLSPVKSIKNGSYAGVLRGKKKDQLTGMFSY